MARNVECHGPSSAPRDTLAPAETRTLPQASVHAGKMITRGKFGVHSESNSGTAALIVRKTDGSPGRFVLTCAHVLGGPSIAQGLAKEYEDVVYSTALSKCIIEWNSPVGKVVDNTLVQPTPLAAGIEQYIAIDGTNFGVDCALIELSTDASADNVVEEIGAIAGVRDLITEWNLQPTGAIKFDPSRQLAVQKYGATTDYTKGTLTGLTPRTVTAKDGSQMNAFVLEIAGSGNPKTITYNLDMDRITKQDNTLTNPQMVADQFKNSPATASIVGSDNKTLQVTATNFSLPGDSGSPVVDSNKKLIGILARGAYVPIYEVGKDDQVDVYTGTSYAILISAALQYLNVEMLPNTQNASGRAAVRPGMTIRARHGRDPETELPDETLSAIAGSEEGALLYAIVRPHFAEIRDLITSNRQVAVMWHRARGAGFANALIRSTQFDGFEVPAAIDGTSLVDALACMRDVLFTQGSESLQATICDFDPWLLKLSRKDRLLQIHNASGIPGTASAIVRDHRGSRYLLSNHHVVFGPHGRPGDPIWANPSQGDHSPSTSSVLVGRAAGGRIGAVVCGAETYFVDSALVALDACDEFPPWLRAIFAGPWPTAAATAVPGLEVVKHGPATGRTSGAVADVAYPDTAVVEQQEVPAPNQLLIRSNAAELNYAARGDSGAAVVDGCGRIVGMLWGCNETGDGVACPIEPVLSALDVALAPCPPEIQGVLP